MVLQEPCSVQYSRSEQEAKSSQQDVYDVSEVQPPTQNPPTRASGRGLRVPEERPSVSTHLVFMLQNHLQCLQPRPCQVSPAGSPDWLGQPEQTNERVKEELQTGEKWTPLTDRDLLGHMTRILMMMFLSLQGFLYDLDKVSSFFRSHTSTNLLINWLN